MTPERLAEADISIAMFRHTHPGSFGEMVSELRAEIDRLTDEVDALNSSSDRAATAWHDMVAERDQARIIARILNRRDANLHMEYEIRLGLGLVPPWLTDAEQATTDRTDSVDDLPGMWDQSDLSGGETDTEQRPRETARQPSCALTPNGLMCACGRDVGHDQPDGETDV